MNISSRFRIIIVLVVIFLAIASSIAISLTIYKFRNIPFPWDPGGYACEGLRIAKDLKTGDIISFLADTYRQSFWPFFHSWLLALAFILFGNTYAVARSVSLFCFILFIPTIYLISIEMSEKQGHWIGIITVFLALTSTPFLILSSMCMREIPGLLMTFITLLFYLKAIKQQKTFLYVFTSFLMALTLFTKWHHGVFVISAIFLTQLTSGKKILYKNNYYLFSPFFAVMIAWFIYPPHISSFYYHSTFQPHFYRFLSFENWLYYPDSFLKVYHSSAIIAVILAIGFLYSLKGIKDPKIRLFATHFLIGMIFLTIKLDNRHRYIITIVPTIWILGASQLVEIVYYFTGRLNNKKIRIALASIIIFGFSIISLLAAMKVYKKYPDSLLKYNFYCDEKINKAYEFIAEKATNHNHIAVFGIWDYYNSLKSSTIRWNIGIRREKDVVLRKTKKNNAVKYFSQVLTKRDKESYNNFIRFLKNKDITVKEYHTLSFMKALNIEAYTDYREKKDINPFSDKIIDVNSLDDNISCLIIVYNEKEIELTYFTEQFLSKQDEWIEVKREKFVDLGITITIYKRKVAQLQT